MVERAPLRPVPRRPGGPVEPGLAGRRVAERLPRLDPVARDALALVTLAGRTRAEAAARLELSGPELSAALARGRKQLRRAAAPLAGSGWCERAEMLISDRLDDALDERGAARLDVHLRNCPRCVEHERLLVGAVDSLVEGLAGGLEPSEADPPALRLAPEARPAAPPPTSVGKAPIASLPFGAAVAPSRPPAQRIDPPLQPPGPTPAPPQQPPEQPPVEPPRPPGPEPAPPDRPPEQPIEPPVRPPGPVESGDGSAQLPERVAAAAVEPIRRSARELVAVASWRVLFALAVIFAIAVVAITVWGATGGEL